MYERKKKEKKRKKKRLVSLSLLRSAQRERDVYVKESLEGTNRNRNLIVLK